MNEYLQPVLLNANALVSATTAVRLLFWRLSQRPGCCLRGLIIYFLIVSCPAVAIRTLTGEYYFADWAEAVINSALCLFCLLNGDNLLGAIADENQ